MYLPEMHRAYQRDIPAIKIVASGLKDSVGLYVKPDSQEYETCRWWMQIFGLEGLEDRTFLNCPVENNVSVLLARAFVKDLELLIRRATAWIGYIKSSFGKNVIEAFCKRKNKTLIMVTHYAEELPKCIDHSIFLVKMKKQKIIERL